MWKNWPGQLKEDLMNDTTNIEKLISNESEHTDCTELTVSVRILIQPAKQKDYIKMQELIKN